MSVGGSFDFASVWLFSGLSRSELRSVAKKARARSAAAGSVLCDEGDVGQELYVILSGQAEVLRNGRRAAVLGPGDYFGELALLDRLPRSATVRAASNMELMVIGQKDFNALLSEVPALTRKLLAATAARLRTADAKALGAALH
ncbi:MAG: cyclic nucleotide-binding domain-containing protein [Acidimicrobiales bacterium]